MKHQHPTDEVLELAAGYALGTLDPEQAASFESHLAEGCGVCDREVRTFAAVAGHLGYAALAEAPRAEVRNRLLARIQVLPRGEAVQPGWTIVRSAEGEWQGAGIEGLFVKPLFLDAAGQMQTLLGRMAAGVRYPSHRHVGTEQLYVLEGEITVEGRVLRAGDFCGAISETVHDRSFSTGGCTILLEHSTQDEVLDGSKPRPPQEGIFIITSAERAWQPGPLEGVEIKRIFSDPARDAVTGLVRMRAGAKLPSRWYGTGEQLYILEGSANVMGHVLHAGDYCRAGAETSPEGTYTKGGCTLLLISSPAELLA